MPVSADDLRKLKNPFGELVPDRDVTEKRIRKLISGSKKIVTVGDATTERLVSFGILPDIAVIDFRERRSLTERRFNYPAKEFRCSNPSGTISSNAVEVLSMVAKRRSRSRVVVDGEEDMLALPLFYILPIGSIVLYGQPLEGMVVVRITSSKQDESKALMDRIVAKVVAPAGKHATGHRKTATRRSQSTPKRAQTKS
jgi:uncharacterized protein (UPF0218 family)